MSAHGSRYSHSRSNGNSKPNGNSQSNGNSHSHAEADHLENTGSGIIRASIFGVSDGLVSNLALVMGVAGGTTGADAVVLAGTAGLLAGAFSMAAGEYVSMRVQRETMERQLRLEREHIDAYPMEEEAHLADLLAESGLEADVAADMARKIHEKGEPAVGFHALLELGIVPRQLGSPIAAAVASSFSFVAGAAVPLLPWLVTDHALVASIACSAAALLAVGGAVTHLTKRSLWSGALRQLGFGGAAAAVTYWVGRAIGTLL